ELQFSRVELNQNLAGSHFLAQFGVDAGDHSCNLAAHAHLVERSQRSGQIHLALNRDSLNWNRLDSNSLRLSAPASAAPLSRLGFALRLRLGLRVPAASCEAAQTDNQ